MSEHQDRHTEKELQEIAPKLASHKPAKVFDVPADYFGKLEGEILEKAFSEAMPPLRRIFPYRRILAYAASMLLFTSLAWAAYRYIVVPAIRQEKNSPEIEKTAKQPELDKDAIQGAEVISGEGSHETGGYPLSGQGSSASVSDPPSGEGAPSGSAQVLPSENRENRAHAANTATYPASSTPLLRSAMLCLGEDAIINVIPVQSAVSYRLLVDGASWLNWKSAGTYSMSTKGLDAGNHRIELQSVDQAGARRTVSSATLILFDIPYVNIGEDACYAIPQLLSAGISRNANVLWQDGSRSENYLAKQSGKYWVTLSNKELPRCQDSDTVRITILPPPADQIPEQMTLCNGEELRLSPRDLKSGYKYHWQPGGKEGATLFLRGLKPGTYEYSLEIAACERTYSENIQIYVDDCGIVVPNVITPNGDGANDRFVIGNLEKYPMSYLAVFDRNGNKVFESNDYQNDWDAESLPNGTYFYILKMRKGPFNERSGTISVVR